MSLRRFILVELTRAGGGSRELVVLLDASTGTLETDRGQRTRT